MNLGAPNCDPTLMYGVLDAFRGLVLHGMRPVPPVGTVNHTPAHTLSVEHDVCFYFFIDLENESD